MGLLNLHNKNINIEYKNSLCSLTTLIICILTICVIVFPCLLIYYINYDLWINNINIYEQPKVNFKYQYIYIAETININNNYDDNVNIQQINNSELITCSSYDYYNQMTNKYQKCTSIKVCF